jgi:hypothetical protein
MSAKDRRAMDGPSVPCPGKREKRKSPDDSFIVIRWHRGAVLPLGYFSLDKQREGGSMPSAAQQERNQGQKAAR